MHSALYYESICVLVRKKTKESAQYLFVMSIVYSVHIHGLAHSM